MHHLGLTRSTNRQDHLLQTPDTFVRTPLPGLSEGMAIVHAAPQMGAGFAMSTLEFEAGGTLVEGPGERFVYVLEGSLIAAESGVPQPQMLPRGGFAFFPAGFAHSLRAEVATRAVVLEKQYQFLPTQHGNDPHADHPTCVIGYEPGIAPVPVNADGGVTMRTLLPASQAFDLAVNTMTYAPGASLAQVEIHYMEHGLLMLEGGGIYRLGEAWYPVEAGDFIWMSPFCPQWFGALGKSPAKYLIYKDCNRHVIA